MRGGYQPQHLTFFDDKQIDDIICGRKYCYVHSSNNDSHINQLERQNKIYRTGSNDCGQLLHTKLKLITFEELNAQELINVKQIICVDRFVVFLARMLQISANF